MPHLFIRSAHSLSATQVQSVIQAVEKKYRSKLSESEIEVMVDPSLLAGVEIQIGSQLLRATLKQELAQLRAHLSQAAITA